MLEATLQKSFDLFSKARRYLPLAIFTTCLIVIFSSVYSYATDLKPWGDWVTCFRPAIIEMLSGRSPYTVGCFFNPPWILIPFIPLVVLPFWLGNAILGAIGILCIHVALLRMGASRLAAFLFLLIPQQLIILALTPNIDWLVLLGTTLPPVYGLFFVLAKPQLGGGVALYWFISCWRMGGWRRVFRIFAPVTIVFILSFLVYGFYFSKTDILLTSAIDWNVSLWPYTIPIGVVLMIHAIRTHKVGLALVGSPFLSPYMTIYSWIASAAGVVSVGNTEVIAVVVGFWIVFILRGWVP